MKRVRGLVAVVGLCALLLGGCSGAKKGPVIGVSLLNVSNEFIVMLNKSMDEKAKQLGVELIVNDAQRSAERQVQQVESFVAQKVDAIILNPCEVEASSPAVDKAIAAGIPIVNVNSETRSAPTAFVGSKDEESARLAMEYIAQRLGGKGEIVMMHGFMGQAAQIKRDDYQRHLARLLELGGFDHSIERAAAVMQLEVALARAHATAEFSADDKNAGTLWTRADFTCFSERMVRASSPSSARIWLICCTKLVVPSASARSKIS